MLSIKEVRSLGSSLSSREFGRQLGPFVLVQQPKEGGPELAQTAIAKPSDIERGVLSLLFMFEELSVATLPPLEGVDQLVVGRQPDCDLVIEGEKSVSKRHAVLAWDAEKNRCTVKDLGSTNGSFLNGSILGQRETPLRDGDIISFGEAQFWYLLTETLHQRLGNSTASRKVGARSG